MAYDQILDEYIRQVADLYAANEQIFHQIINGDEDSEIMTESGPVPTVAKAIKDIRGVYDEALAEETGNIIVNRVAAENAASAAAQSAVDSADAAVAALNDKITVSTEAPSGGVNGDLWFRV